MIVINIKLQNKNKFLGKEMPASLGIMVETIFGIIGSQSLLHLGTLSVQLSESSLVLIAVCSVMSNCLLYLVVVSIVVVSHPILCTVVRE